MLVADRIFGVVSEIPDKYVAIHKETQCRGRHCVFHNPSEHSMVDWKMVLRLDKEAIVERICEHGVGHPDPDSLAFFEKIEKGYLGIHGCDGCCEKAEPTESTVDSLEG
jgi:hypothetical protein